MLPTVSLGFRIALEPSPPAALVCAKILITTSPAVVHVTQPAPVKYQPAAQAPAPISLMIPRTVVLAMQSHVLDSRLAAVRVAVLILRPRLPIAAHVVIRVAELHQLAALGLAATLVVTPYTAALAQLSLVLV
ncbi:hypothetical protein PITC_070390 [Penicillium italicum]|uniref:Uncharacterized protein n=1 Tax=Penicillium italicum TaxID=40296 RepID=A0A0A2KKV3_PENIT|nr:hypothetical protein PITC_070390 [Penicillium italicum]